MYAAQNIMYTYVLPINEEVTDAVAKLTVNEDINSVKVHVIEENKDPLLNKMLLLLEGLQEVHQATKVMEVLIGINILAPDTVLAEVLTIVELGAVVLLLIPLALADKIPDIAILEMRVVPIFTSWDSGNLEVPSIYISR